jgi:hypothetical protein
VKLLRDEGVAALALPGFKLIRALMTFETRLKSSPDEMERDGLLDLLLNALYEDPPRREVVLEALKILAWLAAAGEEQRSRLRMRGVEEPLQVLCEKYKADEAVLEQVSVCVGDVATVGRRLCGAAGGRVFVIHTASARYFLFL